MHQDSLVDVVPFQIAVEPILLLGWPVEEQRGIQEKFHCSPDQAEMQRVLHWTMMSWQRQELAVAFSVAFDQPVLLVEFAPEGQRGKMDPHLLEYLNLWRLKKKIMKSSVS